MASREQLLRNIDGIYAARARGDKEAVARYWAPGATVRLVGERSLLKDAPIGPGDAHGLTNDLIDMFEFHELERVDVMVEGDTVAVHWNVKVSTGGGVPVETELYDLWTFDAEGRAVSLVQFTDTALVAHIIQQASGDAD